MEFSEFLQLDRIAHWPRFSAILYAIITLSEVLMLIICSSRFSTVVIWVIRRNGALGILSDSVAYLGWDRQGTCPGRHLGATEQSVSQAICWQKNVRQIDFVTIIILTCDTTNELKWRHETVFYGFVAHDVINVCLSLFSRLICVVFYLYGE